MPAPPPDANADKMFTATIYLPTDSGELSARTKELKKTANMAKATLEALLEEDDGKFFPKDVKVLGLEVDGKGRAVVNFNQRILDKEAPDQEMETTGLGAIVRTLAEHKNINEITINVEGQSSGRIGDKDIENWWGFNSLKMQPFSVTVADEGEAEDTTSP